MRYVVFEVPVKGSVANPKLGEAMQAAKRAGARLLSLEAEPNNPHHPYAIAVFLHRGGRRWKVGYLPRRIADMVEGRPTQLRVHAWRWVGSDDWPGVRIRLAVPEALDRRTGRPMQLSLW